jgi:hypothetical protein
MFNLIIYFVRLLPFLVGCCLLNIFFLFMSHMLVVLHIVDFMQEEASYTVLQSIPQQCS